MRERKTPDVSIGNGHITNIDPKDKVLREGYENMAQEGKALAKEYPDEYSMAEKIVDELMMMHLLGFDRTLIRGAGTAFVVEQFISERDAHERANNAELRAKTAERDARKNAATNLPNHLALEERLNEIAAKDTYESQPAALLYLDIDGLGELNGLHGHDAGDFLLREAGKIIKSSIRLDDALFLTTEEESEFAHANQDTLYHKHGDEMQIVLENTDIKDAEITAQRIIDALRSQLLHALQGAGYLADIIDPLLATIGISYKKPGEKKTPQQLLQEGDIAVMNAKRLGKELGQKGQILINDGQLSDPNYVKS